MSGLSIVAAILERDPAPLWRDSWLRRRHSAGTQEQELEANYAHLHQDPFVRFVVSARTAWM